MFSLHLGLVITIPNSFRPPAAAMVKHRESVRSLSDRVSVLEQDHKRLNKSVENKFAVQAEANDFAENQRCICLRGICHLGIELHNYSE